MSIFKNRILKISIIAIGILSLLFVGGLLFLVKELPSQSEIGSMLKKPLGKSVLKTAPVQSQVNKDSNELAPSEESEEDPYIPEAQGKSESSPEAFEKIKALMSEDQKDIRVCDNLTKAKIKKKEDVKIENIFEMENRDDPFYEAVRVPIRAIFQEPSVVELFSETETLMAEKANTGDSESILSKTAFYAKAARVAANLYQQKSYFEQLGDHAEHLMILSKLAALKPNLSSDSRVYDFCLAVENSLKFNEESSVKEERTALLELLSSVGVQPQELDFNPNSFNKFAIKLDKNQMQFTIKSE